MIVWDWGAWEPEAETPDPAAAIEAGELKFRLRGEKLRGRYTIVRTSGRGRGARGRAGAGERRAFEGTERTLTQAPPTVPPSASRPCRSRPNRQPP